MGRRTFCAGGAAALALAGKARPAEPIPNLLRRGLYSDPEARLAAIGAFPEFGEGQYLFDYASDRAGRLSRAGADFRLMSTFAEEGDVLALLRPTTEGLLIDAGPYLSVPLQREPFIVTSGGVELHGELAARADRPPRGGLLLVYGSGPAPHEALDLWAFAFLAAGWLVATYDKRGSGRSGGDWRRAGLETLASDAEAVLGPLNARLSAGLPTGVWAASQGGWIAPQLGARGLVDFIILHAVAAVTPGEQILQMVVEELGAYGFPPAEIARARSYFALDTDVSRGVRPWAEIESAYQLASADGAEWLLGPPAAPDAPEREMIRLMADFEPAPYWRANRAPTLALFGGKDVIVPARPNRARLEALVPADSHLQVRLLPDANHLGFIADSGVRAEYARRTRLASGYFEVIDDWTRSLFPGAGL